MLKTLLATSVAMIVGVGVANAADKKVVISVYGFAQDEFKEILYTPFEKMCGCEVVVETGNSVERLAKLEVLGREGSLGVGGEGHSHLVPSDVDVGVVVCYLGCEGCVRDESNCFGEILEHEGSRYFLTVKCPIRVIGDELLSFMLFKSHAVRLPTQRPTDQPRTEHRRPKAESGKRKAEG